MKSLSYFFSPQQSIREKLACALSPESLRKKSSTSGAASGNLIPESPDTHNPPAGSHFGISPQKKKISPPNSSFLVKRSKIEEEDKNGNPTASESEDIQRSNGLPLSPSINFIDASMGESFEKEEAEDKPILGQGERKNSEAMAGSLAGVPDLKLEASPSAIDATATTIPADPAVTVSNLQSGNNNRFSTASSTDDDPSALPSDQLVVVQIHHEPIPESLKESSCEESPKEEEQGGQKEPEDQVSANGEAPEVTKETAKEVKENEEITPSRPLEDKEPVANEAQQEHELPPKKASPAAPVPNIDQSSPEQLATRKASLKYSSSIGSGSSVAAAVASASSSFISVSDGTGNSKDLETRELSSEQSFSIAGMVNICPTAIRC